jgi:hypothetical protein
MSATVSINTLMSRFRLATRELFNNYFRVEDPYNNDGWLMEERFSAVQAILFQKLVTEPASLQSITYGNVQPGILVELKQGIQAAPGMLNREINSGYWDHPVTEVTRDSRLLFLSFFDWDQLDYRDNRYVRVQIADWSRFPETVGKHALIETRHVIFAKA